MLFNMEEALPGSSSSRSSEAFNMVMKGRAEIGFEAYDVQGQAHVITGSQDIDMKMTMSNSGTPNGAAGMTMTMTEEIQYKHEASKTASSFSASVNVNGNNSVEHYVIDGVAVTAEAYNSERERFANSKIPLTLEIQILENGLDQE